MREEVDKFKQQIQISITNQNDGGIRTEIQQLRQQLADLAEEVNRRK